MFKDITGQRFGKLISETYLGPHKSPAGKAVGSRWQCRCDCGRTIETQSALLLRGNTKSCGCAKKETAHRTHGASSTPEYGHWRGIIARCTNPKSINWKNYGGRGIAI